MIYIIILVLLYLFCLYLHIKNRKLQGVFYVIPIIMILVAGFRDGTFFPDYDNYKRAFLFPRENMEHSFILVRDFVKWMGGSYIYLFLIYSIISISLKVYAIKRISLFVWLSMATYIATSYLLHDMIQIRASVAIGFILCSIYFLLKKKYILWIIFSICAVYFHYSAVIVFILPLLNIIRFDRYKWILLLTLSFIVSSFSINIINLISYINYEPIQQLFFHHMSNMEDNGKWDTINIFNTLHLIRCFIAVYFAYNYIIISKYSYADIMLKMYFVGLISIGMLSALPVMAFRISEMFCVVEIFVLSFFFVVIKKRSIAWLCYIFSTCSIMYIQIFYNKYIIL